MPDRNQIVIQDACILFDLVDLALLKVFFQLDLIVLTTLQVIDEITNESQWAEIEFYLSNGKLSVDSEGTYEAIFEIFEEYSGLSFADSSILELAFRKNAVILSSDGSLRKIATRNNYIVRGTLWIIEELCLNEIITPNHAIEKLEMYSSINQRAPIREIEHLISKLNDLT